MVAWYQKHSAPEMTMYWTYYIRRENFTGKDILFVFSHVCVHVGSLLMTTSKKRTVRFSAGTVLTRSTRDSVCMAMLLGKTLKYNYFTEMGWSSMIILL